MTVNLLIDEPPLQVLPTLAKLVGLNEAIVLQQIHYWLNPHHNKNIRQGHHWVFNSYEDWQAQFPFWSKDTIRRVIAALEKEELLFTDNFNKDRFNHRKWYRVNYTKLQELKNEPARSVQTAQIEECKLHTSTMAKCIEREVQVDMIEHGNKPQSTGADFIDHYKEQRILAEITTENTQMGLVPLYEEMIYLWNDSIAQKSSKVQLTQKRLKRLDKITETYFSSQLQNWEHYCRRISTSRFLMGNGRQGWKVTFDWATEPQNIQKILEGNFDGEDYKLNNCKKQITKQEVLEIIGRNKGDEKTQLFLSHLAKEISLFDFMSFFEDVKILNVSEKTARISVPKAFYVTYVSQKFSQSILRSLKAFDASLEHFDLVFMDHKSPKGLDVLEEKNEQ